MLSSLHNCQMSPFYVQNTCETSQIWVSTSLTKRSSSTDFWKNLPDFGVRFSSAVPKERRKCTLFNVLQATRALGLSWSGRLTRRNHEVEFPGGVVDLLDGPQLGSEFFAPDCFFKLALVRFGVYVSLRARPYDAWTLSIPRPMGRVSSLLMVWNAASRPSAQLTDILRSPTWRRRTIF